MVAALHREEVAQLPRFRFLVAAAAIWFGGYAGRAAHAAEEQAGG
jgi:hypothetical protein